MKTIAVTIDEETLERVDELAASSDRYTSRSALVRARVGRIRGARTTVCVKRTGSGGSSASTRSLWPTN